MQLGTSLAPGQSEPLTIPVTDQVADGPWKATLEVKSGLLRKTFHAEIRFPHDEGIAPATALDSAVTSRLGIPAKVLVPLILLSAAVLLVTSLRCRRRKKNA